MEGNVFSAPIAPHGGVSVVNRELGKPIDEVFDNKVMEVDKNIAPSLYEGRFGKPYITEALGLGNTYLKAAPGALENSQAVDSFIRSQMSQNGIADTKDGYKETLDRICNMLDISKDTDPALKLQKLSRLMNVRGMKKLAYGN